MMNNGVNIKRLQEDVKMLSEDVEKLKDSNREIIYKKWNRTINHQYAFMIDTMFISI